MQKLIRNTQRCSLIQFAPEQQGRNRDLWWPASVALDAKHELLAAVLRQALRIVEDR